MKGFRDHDNKNHITWLKADINQNMTKNRYQPNVNC